MAAEGSRSTKKRFTSVGIICELAKTKSQENYLFGIQRRAVSDLDLEQTLATEEERGQEKRWMAEIELLLEQHPERFQADKEATRQAIHSLKEKINHLNEMAENVQQYDLKTYRDFVLDIENTITELSNANKLTLGKLKFDHMDIVADLPEPVDLLREEQKFMKRRPKPLKGSLTKNTSLGREDTENSTCDYKEIKIFDRFLQSHGGHSGGWSDEQHSIYLSLKAKYRANLHRIEECFKGILPGKKSLRLTLVKSFEIMFLFLSSTLMDLSMDGDILSIDIDAETIKSHDDWFQEYTTLKNNRKRAIEQWKKDKNG